MNRPIVACVLAGGTGTRLYPASRRHRPKQFLSFGGRRSLLERTIDRLDFADHVAVATRPDLADQVPEHASDADIIVEPAPRDTGPALVYATREIAVRYDDPVVLALPSDHDVGDGFAEACTTAAETAVETGGLVAIGLEPDRPATGYGYIEPGTDHGAYRDLAAFHEKPDAETAASYVESGYRWNAGIFAWTPDALLSAVRDSALEPLLSALDAGDDPADAFGAVEPISIDHAVMERATDASVVPADFAWDDVGNWAGVERVFGTPGDANTELCEALAIDAAGNVIASDDTHVSVVGVDDLVVAAWDDRVLVIPKDEAERVREVVDHLRDGGLY